MAGKEIELKYDMMKAQIQGTDWKAKELESVEAKQPSSEGVESLQTCMRYIEYSVAFFKAVETYEALLLKDLKEMDEFVDSMKALDKSSTISKGKQVCASGGGEGGSRSGAPNTYTKPPKLESTYKGKP